MIPHRPSIFSRTAALGFLLLSVFVSNAAEETRAVVPFSVRGGLPNVFEKLERGGPVRIAYIGGSITEQDGWRGYTTNWFATKFPDAEIVEIEAAIGGTNSVLGAYRLGHDVLRHRPDLLFVEFSGNDKNLPPFLIRRSMEGIVRQTLKANPETDICFAFTVSGKLLKSMQAGRLPPSSNAADDVAEHYNLPSVSMGYKLPAMIEEGRVIFKSSNPAPPGKIVFSADGVHPHKETGQRLYFEMVERALPELLKAGQAGARELPEPLEPKNMGAARMLPVDSAKLSGDWTPLGADDSELAAKYGPQMHGLWVARESGSKLRFCFKGTGVGIYTLLGPDCGMVRITLDGESRTARLFDAYSDRHRLSMLTVGDFLSPGKHVVEVEVLDEPIDKAGILMESKRAALERNPAAFEGHAFYAGGLMVDGELIACE